MPGVDRGLQAERTALAWQRTSLSLVVVSIALSRLAFGRLGFFSFVGILVAIPVSLWMFWSNSRRHDHGRTSPDGPSQDTAQSLAESHDGLASALLSVAITVVSLTAFAAVLV